MASLTPVDYDPFAQGQGSKPTSGSMRLTPVDHDPFQPQQPASTGEDVAKSFGSGIVRGAAEGVMAPASLATWGKSLVSGGLDYLENGIRSITGMQPISPEEQAQRQAVAERTSPVSNAIEAGQSAVRGAMSANLHAPQTTAGEYARTIGEFMPAALAPGGIMRRAASVVVPAVLSEGAGQATKGTSYEPAARMAGALAGGIGVGLAGMRSAPERLVQRGASGIDKETLQTDWTAARQLLADAQARGVSLTPAEAMNQVSGGRYRDLARAQRIVESTGGGTNIMDDFMARRPAQVQAAGRQALDELSPRTMDPVQLGTRLQGVATGAVDDLRANINAGTREAYRASATDIIPQTSFERIAGDPAFQVSLQRLRNDPVLGPRYATLPDNSVGVVDAVTKDMSAAAEAARNSANAGFNPERGMVYGVGADQARAAATQASPAYAQALSEQAARRQSELLPLENGPMGQIAGTSSVTGQRDALFPTKPEAGMSPVVGETVRKIAARDPEAALGVVRQHAETVFNDATKALQSGPNQFGGAKFSTAIRANPEAESSLREAVQALPGGKERWSGFNRFVDVMEATGRRLQRGSETAFNTEDLSAWKGGGVVGKVAASGVTEIPRMMREAYERYRFGQNTQELARILTSPRAVPLFERLLKTAPNTVRELNLATALVSLGFQTGLAKTQASNQER